MNMLNSTLKKIDLLNERIMESAQKRLDALTKPQGSLGRLEEVAQQICGITGKLAPELKNKVIFTLASDHGVTEEGVSAFPKEVTAQMVYNFLNGGAGINVLAKHVGARVVIADLGVAKKLTVHSSQSKFFRDKKINFGTKNFTKGPAMTKEEAVWSIEAGIELFEEDLPNGIDIIGTGEMGIGNTTSSSALCAVFTGKPAEVVTGKGTGINDVMLENKIQVINQAIKLNQPDPKDALGTLSQLGGFEIGGLAGVILAACAKKIPVVLDGFISSAAALVAVGLAPNVKEYLIASHCSVEIGHRIILDHLGLKPLFDLNLRLGEGTGAALGIGFAEAAIKILTQMATFESAKVSEKDKP